MEFREADPSEAEWFKHETRRAGSEEELALHALAGEHELSSQDPEFERALERLAEIGTAVYRVVPERYDAYCKILHPIYELLDVQDRNLTWDEWERKQRAESPTAENSESSELDEALRKLYEQSTLWKGGVSELREARRVSWSELAGRYGVKYVPEISGDSFRRAFGSSWPRYLVGAAEGDLASAQLRAVIRVLADHGQDEVLCFFELLKEGAATGKYEDRLFHGTLSGLEAFTAKLGWGSPSAFWPADRAWFVATDWDLEFTLVGGTRAAVMALDGEPSLETLRVEPDTRVDYQADRVNS